jgi:chemotaxis protein methyltransferase CheR
MKETNNVPVFQTELAEPEFNRLSKFIMSEYGIKMPPEKRVMLQSRLQRRLKALNIGNFREYVDFVFSPKGQVEEVIHMMDVVSTNKTDFFRESNHFDFLLCDALPDLFLNQKMKNISAWSAGCSSGEEPYTIAITLSEFRERHPGFEFSITASDISTKMLEKAAAAIYPEEKIQDVPHSIKTKYFLRSKDREVKKIRVIPELRSKISFYRQNLLYLLQENNPQHSIVFCRNVLIYFDRNNQQTILSRLCDHLKPGGYLFLGHSESITGFELPVQQIKPTVFKHL